MVSSVIEDLGDDLLISTARLFSTSTMPIRLVCIMLALLLVGCASTDQHSRPTTAEGWVHKFWGFAPTTHAPPESMSGADRAWVKKYYASAHNCGPGFVERVRQSLEDFGAVCRVIWNRDGSTAMAYHTYLFVMHPQAEGWGWQRLLEYQIKYHAMLSRQVLVRFEPLPIRVQPSSAIAQHFFGKMILETGEERPVSVVVFKKRGEFQGLVSSSAFLAMRYAGSVQAMHEYLLTAP